MFISRSGEPGNEARPGHESGSSVEGTYEKKKLGGVRSEGSDHMAAGASQHWHGLLCPTWKPASCQPDEIRLID